MVVNSLRMQEMGPALRNHHLKTQKCVPHILVAPASNQFLSTNSIALFPGLHGMMRIRRNPKVYFEELLLPLQQDPATRVHLLVTPVPSSCDYLRENKTHPCSYCNQPPDSQQPLRLLLCSEMPARFIPADARGPLIMVIPLLIRRCQADSSSDDRHKPPALPSTVLMMQLL